MSPLQKLWLPHLPTAIKGDTNQSRRQSWLEKNIRESELGLAGFKRCPQTTFSRDDRGRDEVPALDRRGPLA